LVAQSVAAECCQKLSNSHFLQREVFFEQARVLSESFVKEHVLALCKLATAQQLLLA
jgi:hypothetical protein